MAKIKACEVGNQEAGYYDINVAAATRFRN
jgi:hypothetical protein